MLRVDLKRKQSMSHRMAQNEAQIRRPARLCYGSEAMMGSPGRAAAVAGDLNVMFGTLVAQESRRYVRYHSVP